MPWCYSHFERGEGTKSWWMGRWRRPDEGEKSYPRFFERLYLPSRLRNSLTYLSFTKEIEIHAHKRVIMMLFVCLFYLAFFLFFLWFLPLFVSLYMLIQFFFVMVFLITCSHVYVYYLIAVWLSRGAWWCHSGIQYPGGGNFASQEELSRSCTRRAQHGFDEKPAWNPHENLWLLGNHVHQEILRGLCFNCEPRPL